MNFHHFVIYLQHYLLYVYRNYDADFHTTIVCLFFVHCQCLHISYDNNIINNRGILKNIGIPYSLIEAYDYPI